ncbi:MAG: hypothetical protein LBB15_02685 [Puniceicoccales bacterium]|jgi:hypothetical protein|nr:hypothetical protein [Puniceicoccales bacterium]
MKIERFNNYGTSSFNRRLNGKNPNGKNIRQKANTLFYSTDETESNCPIGESGMMRVCMDLSGAMAFINAFTDASE